MLPMKNAPIHYRIVASSPEAHHFEITLCVQQPDSNGQRFSLPAWIPGSYLIREFARNIVSLRAEQRGKPVSLHKIDKHTWQAAPGKGPLTLVYTIYAFDLSVRGAYLDSERGFFNGSSVFLAVEGQTELPCSVEIVAPDGKAYRDWRVATSLPAHKAEPYAFGSYLASNYDELIDHPVEMGNFSLVQFKACGVPHDFVLAGRYRKIDSKRLARDVKKICEYQIRLFGEPAPFQRYVFMTVVTGDGYGGLEHRASTALMCSRGALPLAEETGIKSAYREFLGLISHEYFHSWNVKRLKPAAYAPYDLSREAYTRLLWAFEGITSYYDDLTLVRCGLIDQAGYLELLAQTMTTVSRAPGQSVQTLEESSFDTWIKLYRPDENTPNAGISYYSKGSLAALCLDLHIRAETAQQKSLDDVMLALWQRYGRDFYAGQATGIGEAEWEAVAEEVTGLTLKPLFDALLRKAEPLPLELLLSSVGVSYQSRSAYGAADKGGWVENPKAAGVWLGLRTSNDNGWAKVSHVLSDGPAQRAGLSGGDLLLALDGLKITAGNIDNLLAGYHAGDKVEVHAFRRDELMKFKLELSEMPGTTIGLKLGDVGKAKLAARAAWLGS